MAQIPNRDDDVRARFTQALLQDLRALEQMIEAGQLETDAHRIGAEQEVFLVDRGSSPAPIATEILEAVGDARLTNELARFNLEANLTPVDFTGRCLSDMERELEEVLAEVRAATRARDADVVLVGILPTLRQSDLSAQNMTPLSRYADLDRAVREGRGDDFRVQIKGVDELDVVHENVMLESCNTSFQLHFQVSPEEFTRYYNAAQLVSAPVLACAANSPVLLQHRLWAETRIALFRESFDDRAPTQRVRGDAPRVWFGDAWVKQSVLEIFRADVARCRLLFATEDPEDSVELLRRGEVPELKTLSLFNGTVYRWNRPCYGITDGKPHLRIENRVLPAGPTVLDAVANAAFYYGLLVAVADRHPDLGAAMPFDDAKQNFFRAARHGLDAQLAWVDGSRRPARTLILQDLLREARSGLSRASIDAADVDRYLDVIEKRVSARRNGAAWMLDSLASMDQHVSSDLRYRCVTAAMLDHQRGGSPVHEWPLARLDQQPFRWADSFATVGQIMTTDPLTVRPGDVVDLAASLMEWERVRYVAVETDDGELAGLISAWSLLRVLTREKSLDRPILVDAVMDEVGYTVRADTLTTRAIELMAEHELGCLPVTENGKLIGLLTQADLVRAADQLVRGSAPQPDERCAGRTPRSFRGRQR